MLSPVAIWICVANPPAGASPRPTITTTNRALNYNSPIYDHYIISRGFVKESGVFLEIRGFSLDLQGK